MRSTTELTDAPGHPEPWVQKYRDQSGEKEGPTFNSLFQDSAKAAGRAATRLYRVQKTTGEHQKENNR